MCVASCVWHHVCGIMFVASCLWHSCLWHWSPPGPCGFTRFCTPATDLHSPCDVLFSPGEGDVPRIGPSPPFQAGRIASKLFSGGFQQRYANRRVSSKPVAPAPSSKSNPPHPALSPKIREEADRPGIAGASVVFRSRICQKTKTNQHLRRIPGTRRVGSHTQCFRRMRVGRWSSSCEDTLISSLLFLAIQPEHLWGWGRWARTHQVKKATRS
jgi:hypothetical protein